MTEILSHRGPDDQGYFFDKNIALGFRRLSIIDLEHGNQPMYNEDESVVVLCNGELYNYRCIRKWLIQRGHQLKTQCDVEILAHLYEEKGIDFLQELNGQFAFVIYDKAKDILYLVRDHVGVIPVYFAFVAGVFIFASEIKALLQHPFIDRELNLHAFNQMLGLPGIPSPGTMFRQIQALRPGHYLSIKSDVIEDVEYWDLEYPRIGDIDYREDENYYIDHLQELLSRSIAYRMQSEVPVGFYLSGGLDSSLISAMASHLDKGRQPRSFSIVFPGREMCESRYQQIMAKSISSLHCEVPIETSDVREGLPDTIYHSEMPLKESYNTACLRLSNAVKQAGVSVILAGEGADELFAGYVGYRFDQLRERQASNSPIRQSELSYLFGMNHGLFYELDADYLRATGTSLFSQRVNEWLAENPYSGNAPVNFGKIEGRHPFHQRSYLDFKLRLSDHLLIDHGDKMALAHSVEARYPFLDIDVIRFATHVPPYLKLRDFTEKYILKEIAKRFVPHDVRRREKFGWFAPGGVHLLRESGKWVEEVLSSDKIASQGYLRPEAIESLKQKYAQPGFKVHHPYENDLLMIALTFSIFLDVFKVSSL